MCGLQVYAVTCVKGKVLKENKWEKLGKKVRKKGKQKKRGRGKKVHRVVLFHRTH